MSDSYQDSMLEVCIELMSRKKKPQNINKLFKEVAEKLDIAKDEEPFKLARFYTDLTMSSMFVYCGEDNWDLKNRQPISLYDKDGAFFLTDEELYEEPKPKKQKVEAKPKTTKVEETIQEENIVENIEDILDDIDEPIEFDNEEVVENNDLDEDKYNEYMDEYEDMYED